MSKLLVSLLLLVAACSSEVTTASSTTTPTTPLTTRPADTTTSTPPSSASGHLIKLDLPTLQPLAGVDPISIERDTWSQASPDGSLVVIFTWDEETKITHARVIDVERWRQSASFELGPPSGLTIHEDWLYTYNHQDGQLSAINLITGDESVMADWSPNHLLYDGPTLLPGDRIAGIAAEPVAAREEIEHSVFILDLETRTTTEHPIGTLERVNLATGVFDGEYEIPETDYPGVVWDDDRLLLAYMDGPEVVEIDLQTGATRSHMIELSSWWDRVWAYWMPSASAKGPSLGTYTSAALSPDGSHLFISGNEQTIEVAADGTLVEESEHLGLVIVDTENWRPVMTPDLPLQYVRAIDGAVLGVDTTSFQPWTSDYYVLSMDRSSLRTRGPLTVIDGHCELATNTRYLLCTEYSPSIRVRIIDIETLEISGERPIGPEDTLLPNGVLVDSFPRFDP